MWLMPKMIAERIFLIVIIIRIISTAIKRGNTINTACIVPTGLVEPGIILTYVIIITGQFPSARGSQNFETRFTFSGIGHVVDGTHLTTPTATGTTSSIAT